MGSAAAGVGHTLWATHAARVQHPRSTSGLARIARRNTLLITHDRLYWDGVAQTWQEQQPQRLWRAYSDAVNIVLFAQWLPETPVERLLKTDVFDEVVSHGLYALMISRAQCVASMDISPRLVQAACTRCPELRATSADVRRLPFADGAFDVIISNSTLDHFDDLSDLVTSLRELRRVLRPGGELLLTLDNLANPAVALRNLLPFRLLQGLGIVPYYVGATCGPYRLQRFLSQVGFDILEVKTLLHCPRVFAVAIARVLEKHMTAETQKRFLQLLKTCESLSRWPGRFFSGYYIAVRSVRR